LSSPVPFSLLLPTCLSCLDIQAIQPAIHHISTPAPTKTAAAAAAVVAVVVVVVVIRPSRLAKATAFASSQHHLDTY